MSCGRYQPPGSRLFYSGGSVRGPFRQMDPICPDSGCEGCVGSDQEAEPSLPADFYELLRLLDPVCRTEMSVYHRDAVAEPARDIADRGRRVVVSVRVYYIDECWKVRSGLLTRMAGRFCRISCAAIQAHCYEQEIA